MLVQVLTLVLVTWLLVLPQLHGSLKSLHLLFRVDDSWVLLALTAELASLSFYTLLTRAMLPENIRPPLHRVVRIDLSAIALGHCLPDGGAAGTALCWRLLVAEGVPSTTAAFAKLAQGLGSAIVLQGLLLASYAIGSTTSGASRWELLPAACSTAILAMIGLTLLAVRRVGVRRRVGRLVSRIPWWGPKLAQVLSNFYRRHLVDQLRSVLGSRRALLITVGFAGANWAFDALALWASLRAYGPSIGLEPLAIAFGIQALAAWLPITPSGLGISEAAIIPALIAFGSSRNAIVLGILTWRVIAYWLPIPLGALAFGSLRAFKRSAVKLPPGVAAQALTRPMRELPGPRAEPVPAVPDSDPKPARPSGGPQLKQCRR
ncbi:lysylphosphatidylglycerol synthase transmembrane domain-containing protein [Rugosimonospora africana]|uniref:Flippase-like domain-containing protein n=1 Tax=Rugosimonospora africana TaxID=556532 RepID=A0A8J3QT19_9ACTN|nr:lysylphosphatidylglycerol synthase transmembrane domain-containing protein [Rugosimonospora africana]GIH15946.1 hypothetical protein Raf01_41180 [Rugosimonospora africana]